MNVEIRKRAEVWLGPEYDERTRAEVKRMLDNEDESELIECFYKDLEFGTGGLRGIMGPGTNRMNNFTVGMATQGLVNYLKKQFPGKQLSGVVACDSRNNSRDLADVVAYVFVANGIKAYLFSDPRPTPELSFAIRHLKCDTGVVITASHNPKEYNGYKAYWNDGSQVVEPHDAGIIAEVSAIKSVNEVNYKGGMELFRLLQLDDYYLNALATLMRRTEELSSEEKCANKIVYTGLHGTGSTVIPKFLKQLGYTNHLCVSAQSVMDGNFPTVESPNPEDPRAWKLALELAEESGANLALATDPDADRAGVAIRDDKNELRLLNGNQTAALLAYYILDTLKEKELLLKKDYMVKTIVTSSLLNAIAKHFGVKIFEVLTGFKYIAAVIREKSRQRFVCGGEESYGFLIGNYVRDKDAVVTCGMIAEMAAMASKNGKTLYDLLMELYLRFGLFHDRMLSLTRKGKDGLEEIQSMMKNYRDNPPKTIDGSEVVAISDYLSLEHRKTSTGRVTRINQPQSDVLQFLTSDKTLISIRPSGTEPKIKFYFELRAELNDRADYQNKLDMLNAKYDRITKELI
ncbi:MAG: phospho-sugar mutase [Prevotellaceae bacterium]|jgi:phosphoglucomutase|nr:phospho-sugar mutase [Prevotellaceae bacterium]